MLSLLVDVYPMSVHIKDDYGERPVDLVRRTRKAVDLIDIENFFRAAMTKTERKKSPQCNENVSIQNDESLVTTITLPDTKIELDLINEQAENLTIRDEMGLSNDEKCHVVEVNLHKMNHKRTLKCAIKSPFSLLKRKRKREQGFGIGFSTPWDLWRKRKQRKTHG